MAGLSFFKGGQYHDYGQDLFRIASFGAVAFPDLESTRELKEDASRKSQNALL